MNSTIIDKHYLSIQFKLKIHSKNGSEFQTFFENIMELYSDDFRKIPSGGGDGGNDGWIRSLGRYYQVYSPDVPAIKDREAAKKLKIDFEKLKKNWDEIETIKEYFFVYNDKYFGAKEPEKIITELKNDNPSIDFKLFLSNDLEKIFFELDETKILKLNFNINKRIAIENGYDYLDKVKIELDKDHAKYAKQRLDDIQNIIFKLNDDNLLLEYEILQCRCLQNLELIDESISKYNTIHNIYPNDPRSLLHLSEIYTNKYNNDESQKLLDKASKINKNHWLIKLEELIKILYTNDDFDISEIDENNFPENYREKSSYYRVYASILEKSGNTTKAKSFIEKAIYLNPERIANYTTKLNINLRDALSINDKADMEEAINSLLNDLKNVENKFTENGDIGYRNKSVLNAINLTCLRALGNIPEFIKIAEETFRYNTKMLF